jgi:hypothetical protein
VTDTANWLTPETAIGCTLPCGAKVVEAWDGKDGGTAVNFDRPPSGGIDVDKFGRCFRADGRHYTDGLPNLIPAAPTSQPLHDDTARVQAMNAPDAIERLRVAYHGARLTSGVMVSADDARAILNHLTALTAERDAAVAEVAQIVAWLRMQCRDPMLPEYAEFLADYADAIAAGAHKEQTDDQ